MITDRLGRPNPTCDKIRTLKATSIYTNKQFIHALLIYQPIQLICTKINFMKHTLLLSLIFLFFCGAASAQTGSGKFYIGGSMNYSYNSYGSENTYSYASGYTNYYVTKVSTFTMSPEFGFFLSNKLSIGIQGSYSHGSGTESSYYYSYLNTTDNYVKTDVYSTNVIGVGLDLRYYCMITEKFGFFPQIGFTTLNNTANLNNGTFAIGASPNFVFFPTKKLGVTLGFGNIGYSLDYQTKNHTITAGLDNNLFLGLNYYWGGK